MTIILGLLMAVSVWLFSQLWFQIALAVLGLLFLASVFSKAPEKAERMLFAVFAILFLAPISVGTIWPSITGSEENQSQSHVVVSSIREKVLTDDELFGVAAHILSLSQTSGCGSFEIVDRDLFGRQATVKCYDGRRHEIENGPILKINGKFVSY